MPNSLLLPSIAAWLSVAALETFHCSSHRLAAPAAHATPAAGAATAAVAEAQAGGQLAWLLAIISARTLDQAW